jgi:hypothetical protein
MWPIRYLLGCHSLRRECQRDRDGGNEAFGNVGHDDADHEDQCGQREGAFEDTCGTLPTTKDPQTRLDSDFMIEEGRGRRGVPERMKNRIPREIANVAIFAMKLLISYASDEGIITRSPNK